MDGLVTTVAPAGFMRVRVYQLAYLAAERAHEGQMRKCGERPYFTHPQAVAQLLVDSHIRDPIVLAAALMHDTIEDCGFTADRVAEAVGGGADGRLVARLVTEVSDPPGSKEERHLLQVSRAYGFTRAAAQVKVADMVCNLRDLAERPPLGMSAVAKLDYLGRKVEVFCAIVSPDPFLSRHFREAIGPARLAAKG